MSFCFVFFFFGKDTFNEVFYTLFSHKIIYVSVVTSPCSLYFFLPLGYGYFPCVQRSLSEVSFPINVLQSFI